MYYTESHNFLDFEKAFDCISWDFIYQVLLYFNFGNYIINRVKILNTNFMHVLQSGFLSTQFLIQRGCRQGDPLAPYLFLLCPKILSVLLKQNHDIRGIMTREKEHKISQYADDAALTLDGSSKSLFAALDTLHLFYKMSGLKINGLKKKVISIGSKKFSNQVFHHSRWKLE